MKGKPLSAKIHEMKRIILTLIMLIAASVCSFSATSSVFSPEDLAADAPPLLKLDSGSGIFAQSKTAILYFVSNKNDLDITGTFQSKDIKAYPYPKMGKNYYRLLLGFSVDDRGNKEYPMALKVCDKNGVETEYHYKVFVKKTKLAVLKFTMKLNKTHMLMPDNIRDDWKMIEHFVAEENDKDYINGQFIRPTGGHVSMAFGVQEYINGAESGKHRGLDFANKIGAPVWASNDGLVRLAQRLPAHGNCVVIEHGQGVFTYYAHLSKILVKPGDFVKKGDHIGLVGMTGVATGPHLHFSMSLHNLRVDPQQWLDGVVKD
jgi:murein DD-endopeptidase MepM/ murein hydrolase activator NlpD